MVGLHVITVFSGMGLLPRMGLLPLPTLCIPCPGVMKNIADVIVQQMCGFTQRYICTDEWELFRQNKRTAYNMFPLTTEMFLGKRKCHKCKREKHRCFVHVAQLHKRVLHKHHSKLPVNRDNDFHVFELDATNAKMCFKISYFINLEMYRLTLNHSYFSFELQEQFQSSI